MIHRSDLNIIYQAVEETVGVNVGVNGVLYNVVAIVGTSISPSLRSYYVPVYFPNRIAAARYDVVVVTIRPLSSPNCFSGTLLGSAPSTPIPGGAATLAVVMTAIAGLPAIVGNATPPVSAVADMAA